MLWIVFLGLMVDGKIKSSDLEKGVVNMWISVVHVVVAVVRKRVTVRVRRVDIWV